MAATKFIATNAQVVTARATTYNLPLQAPSDAEQFFTDPKNHVDVLSTMVSIVMSESDYIPNSSKVDPSPDAAQKELLAFVKFVDSITQRWRNFIHNIDFDSKTLPSSDRERQQMVQEFVKADVNRRSSTNPGTDVVLAILTALKDVPAGGPEECLFAIHNFEGSDIDPVFSAYNIQVRQIDGSPKYLVLQRYVYSLNSKMTTANAGYLAQEKIQRAKDVADWINQYS